MRKISCIALLLFVATNAVAFSIDTQQLLETIALPLAVAAVADIAGVPQDQLGSLVATLNNANLPPAQIIEVVRYVPVALIEEGPAFVSFVQQQTSQGVTGPALMPVIEQRLRPFYPSTQITVAAPVERRVVEVDRTFVPQVVVTRVAEVRAHPHGGPPGQLKKQLGLKTGAEVVHGKQKGRQKEVIVVQQPAPVVTPTVIVAPPQRVVVAGQGRGNREGKNKGKEHGGGKGKNKGKD